MCAHADETDDSHAAVAHPSRLRRRAGGARDGRARAAQRRRAAARGRARLRRRLPADALARCLPSFARTGHSTHSFGPMFGAAAACAALAGLKAPQVRHRSCRTPRSRLRASRAGCATRSTSRKRSTSAACRRATASPPRRWSAHGFTGVEDVFSGERSFFVAYGREPEPRGARRAAWARPSRS